MEESTRAERKILNFNKIWSSADHSTRIDCFVSGYGINRNSDRGNGGDIVNLLDDFDVGESEARFGILIGRGEFADNR